MKATKKIFEKANEYYNGSHVKNELNIVGEEMFKKFLSLEKEYDLSNYLFTDENGKQGLKWCWGGDLVPARYDVIKWFPRCGVPSDECFTIASRDNRDYLINPQGEEIFEADEIKPHLASITPVVFRSGEKWGMADKTGRISLPAKYDSIELDANGFIFLKAGGKIGFVASYRSVIEPQFDSIELDKNDYLIVTLNGVKGYVDENDTFTTDHKNAYYNMQMFL